jgi:hypothetical protein
MPYFTSYQNEGEETYGPFLAPPVGQAGLQKGFISDLRLFLSGRREYTAYLKRVAYDLVTDSWTLVFADPANGSVLVSGTVARTSGGNQIKKGSIGSGPTVAVFTTGKHWGDPKWGGTGSWEKTYVATESEVEASKGLNGPKTIKRILIDGQPDPFSGSYPFDSHQVIIGGYNLQLSETDENQGTIVSPIANLNSGKNTVVLSAGYGLGAGVPPSTQSPVSDILTINGLQSESGSNNFNVSSSDCIKATVPYVTSSGDIIDHEIQIESDCGPCCGCENYRNVAAAIQMSYSKIASLQSTLNSLYLSTYQTYQRGIAQIKALRTNT